MHFFLRTVRAPMRAALWHCYAVMTSRQQDHHDTHPCVVMPACTGLWLGCCVVPNIQSVSSVSGDMERMGMAGEIIADQRGHGPGHQRLNHLDEAGTPTESK